MDINIWSNSQLKKKVGWFVVLMVWVGMVTAVVLNQTPTEQEATPAESDSAEVEIETSSEIEEEPADVEEITSSTRPVDAEEVNREAEQQGTDFFVKYRIERDQARSEQINLLREMINNPNSREELKTKAQEKLLQITDNIEEEMEIESLIRARGYEDGIAFIHDNSAEVIVANGELSQEDVAKIGDIVANITGVSLQNITIIEKPAE